MAGQALSLFLEDAVRRPFQPSTNTILYTKIPNDYLIMLCLGRILASLLFEAPTGHSPRHIRVRDPNVLRLADIFFRHISESVSPILVCCGTSEFPSSFEAFTERSHAIFHSQFLRANTMNISNILGSYHYSIKEKN
jgi:hypothetical protein